MPRTLVPRTLAWNGRIWRTLKFQPPGVNHAEHWSGTAWHITQLNPAP